MNELIKTLQVWSDNPMNAEFECNTSDDIAMCKGISCNVCPMALSGNNVKYVAVKLGEYNERVNTNIIPMD